MSAVTLGTTLVFGTFAAYHFARLIRSNQYAKDANPILNAFERYSLEKKLSAFCLGVLGIVGAFYGSGLAIDYVTLNKPTTSITKMGLHVASQLFLALGLISALAFTAQKVRKALEKNLQTA